MQIAGRKLHKDGLKPTLIANTLDILKAVFGLHNDFYLIISDINNKR
jgi:hypothetical protein